VLQDTPLNDADVEAQLRQSVYEVNNLADREDEKILRVNVRFRRVELFLSYLQKEEDRERREYSLDKYDHPMSCRILPEIAAQFAAEKAWISRRLAENRERYEDDGPFRYDRDEARILGLDDDDEDSKSDDL
jgi:hypothetical protein